MVYEVGRKGGKTVIHRGRRGKNKKQKKVKREPDMTEDHLEGDGTKSHTREANKKAGGNGKCDVSSVLYGREAVKG